ncbi:MAG: DUF4058 family protein [Chloroflexi bacterium]|nr:DUF4058 family protein [Chloroflexota bacterium]
MRSPFPGMDPYLEHPSLWPDVHNRLIAAIADSLSPAVAPNYYVALERRAYLLMPNDLEVLVGRPDLAVMQRHPPERLSPLPLAEAGVVEVEVLIHDEVGDNYLEVRDAVTKQIVTVLELLSPANKLFGQGRKDYEVKREHILQSQTNFVEIDLLRAGPPMATNPAVPGDYRILVSRGAQRPRGHLYHFNLRQPIPSFTLPLLPGDTEPSVDVNTILHALYERARFDLIIDYTQPPVPPLRDADAEWARALIGS